MFLVLPQALPQPAGLLGRGRLGRNGREGALGDQNQTPSTSALPFPETITALFKTSFQIDFPFDLPETIVFTFLG